MPKDRMKPGILSLYDDQGTKQHECLCLGKADNAAAAAAGNPSRVTTEPFGDTPIGTYETTSCLVADHPKLGKYVINLFGATGDAKEARRINKDKKPTRSGLAIHATPPAEIDGSRGEDRLIPTNGCVRVLDRDMEIIARCLGNSPVRVEITE
jgi:hypothetical protein